MAHYEVEIKTLLREKENATKLKEILEQKGFDISNPKRSSQLNHYFIYENLDIFHESILPHIPEDRKESFTKTIKEGNNFSIRTRQSSGKALLVVKASLGKDSSSNGVARMEFEIKMPLTLSDLDQLLLDSGLSYQAKWSRDREEYTNGDIIVCLDKNAGYGYVAEFEKVVNNATLINQTRNDLLFFMKEVGAEELPQDRLERMFAYYNTHWPEYYGTDKTFLVE